MKKIILTLLTFFVFAFGFSQYGYMGKTISLNYNFNMSFAGRNPTYNGWGVGINGTHEFSLLKVLNRKKELGLFGGYSRSSADYRDVMTFLAARSDREEHSVKIKMVTAGLLYRVYLSNDKKWNLAPLGSYIELKPMVSQITIFSFDERYKFTRLTSPGFALGFGRQNIYMNRLLMRFGFEFALSAISPRLFDRLGDDRGYSRDVEPTLDNFKTATVKRMALRSMFMFTFGFGLLAK